MVPEAGLHARPASEFVQTANQFETDLSVGCAGGDSLGDASSMLAVTGLNIGHGESVRIVAEGPDAVAAVAALETVLTTPLDNGSETA